MFSSFLFSNWPITFIVVSTYSQSIKYFMRIVMWFLWFLSFGYQPPYLWWKTNYKSFFFIYNYWRCQLFNSWKIRDSCQGLPWVDEWIIYVTISNDEYNIIMKNQFTKSLWSYSVMPFVWRQTLWVTNINSRQLKGQMDHLCHNIKWWIQHNNEESIH